MEKSLATFMGIAVTAVVIVALLFNQLLPLLQGISDDIAVYIQSFQ